MEGMTCSSEILSPWTLKPMVVTIQENRHSHVWKYAFCCSKLVTARLATVPSSTAMSWLRDGQVMTITTRLMSCMVLVKYLAVLFYFSSGYRNLRMQEANTKPNSHMFMAPPPVIALIPHRHIPQFKAKKNTSIIVMINTDICDSRDANMETVMMTVRVASNPDINTNDDNEEVEVKLCANASAQKK